MSWGRSACGSGTMAATASAQGAGIGIGAGAHDGDFGVHLRKDFRLGGDISAITGQAGVLMVTGMAG